MHRKTYQINRCRKYEFIKIDYNSFINIRPRDNNTKNEIQNELIKAEYKKITEYFFQEAKRWAEPLVQANVAEYIAKIAQDICPKSNNQITMADAEKYLMYSILLQNYALHH